MIDWRDYFEYTNQTFCHLRTMQRSCLSYSEAQFPLNNLNFDKQNGDRYFTLCVMQV